MDPQKVEPFVSVIMPVRNEESMLAMSLDTLLANDYPRERVEFLIVDGESTDRTPAIIADYERRDPRVRGLKNPRRRTPHALNIAIREAKGEIIVRADSHTEYDPDYISACVRLLLTTDAANVGGRQTPVGTNYMSRAIALATMSRFAAGDAKFRYSDKPAWVETVYLGGLAQENPDRPGGI